MGTGIQGLGVDHFRLIFSCVFIKEITSSLFVYHCHDKRTNLKFFLDPWMRRPDVVFVK